MVAKISENEVALTTSRRSKEEGPLMPKSGVFVGGKGVMRLCDPPVKVHLQGLTLSGSIGFADAHASP